MLLESGECVPMYGFYIVFKVNDECLLFSYKKTLQYCDFQCEYLPVEIVQDGQ